MEEQFDILSKLIKRRKPDLPEHFFEKFQNKIITQMDENSDDLTLSKSEKPEVPAHFFRHFPSSLYAAIEEEEAFSDLKIKKKTKPEIPADFEKEFSADLMKKIKSNPARGRVLKLTFWSTAAAVAASLTLLFIINSGSENATAGNLQSETNQEFLAEDDVDTYVAYLDEDLLISYMIENEISTGESETDEVYDYVSGDVEEYYLDL